VTRSPEALSAEFLLAQGYRCGKASWWNPFAHQRRDLHGFADLHAFDPKSGCVVLVQACTWAAVSTRRHKILASPVARDWVRHPVRLIWILGWKKSKRGWKARGEPEFAHKVIEVRAADFDREEASDE